MSTRARRRATLAGLVVACAGLGPASGPAAEDGEFVAAGCLITTPAGVVLNINRALDAVQLPMGRRRGDETPRQTAARETREETGIAVDVGEHIISWRSGAVHLFACAPQAPIVDYAALAPVDAHEVSEVLVIDPHSMVNHDGRRIAQQWRFPHTRALLRELYPRRAP